MSKVLSRQTDEGSVYTMSYLPLALLDNTSTILDYSPRGAYILQRRTRNKLKLCFSYFPGLSHPFPPLSNVNDCRWQQRFPPARQFYQDPAYVPGVLRVTERVLFRGERGTTALYLRQSHYVAVRRTVPVVIFVVVYRYSLYALYNTTMSQTDR